MNTDLRKHFAAESAKPLTTHELAERHRVYEAAHPERMVAPPLRRPGMSDADKAANRAATDKWMAEHPQTETPQQRMIRKNRAESVLTGPISSQYGQRTVR